MEGAQAQEVIRDCQEKVHQWIVQFQNVGTFDEQNCAIQAELFTPKAPYIIASFLKAYQDGFGNHLKRLIRTLTRQIADEDAEISRLQEKIQEDIEEIRMIGQPVEGPEPPMRLGMPLPFAHVSYDDSVYQFPQTYGYNIGRFDDNYDIDYQRSASLAEEREHIRRRVEENKAKLSKLLDDVQMKNNEHTHYVNVREILPMMLHRYTDFQEEQLTQFVACLVYLRVDPLFYKDSLGFMGHQVEELEGIACRMIVDINSSAMVSYFQEVDQEEFVRYYYTFVTRLLDDKFVLLEALAKNSSFQSELRLLSYSNSSTSAMSLSVYYSVLVKLQIYGSSPADSIFRIPGNIQETLTQNTQMVDVTPQQRRVRNVLNVMRFVADQDTNRSPQGIRRFLESIFGWVMKDFRFANSFSKTMRDDDAMDTIQRHQSYTTLQSYVLALLVNVAFFVFNDEDKSLVESVVITLLSDLVLGTHHELTSLISMFYYALQYYMGPGRTLSSDYMIYKIFHDGILNKKFFCNLSDNDAMFFARFLTRWKALLLRDSNSPQELDPRAHEIIMCAYDSFEFTLRSRLAQGNFYDIISIAQQIEKVPSCKNVELQDLSHSLSRASFPNLVADHELTNNACCTILEGLPRIIKQFSGYINMFCIARESNKIPQLVLMLSYSPTFFSIVASLYILSDHMNGLTITYEESKFLLRRLDLAFSIEVIENINRVFGDLTNSLHAARSVVAQRVEEVDSYFRDIQSFIKIFSEDPRMAEIHDYLAQGFTALNTEIRHTALAQCHSQNMGMFSSVISDELFKHLMDTSFFTPNILNLDDMSNSIIEYFSTTKDGVVQYVQTKITQTVRDRLRCFSRANSGTTAIGFIERLLSDLGISLSTFLNSDAEKLALDLSAFSGSENMTDIMTYLENYHFISAVRAIHSFISTSCMNCGDIIATRGITAGRRFLDCTDEEFRSMPLSVLNEVGRDDFANFPSDSQTGALLMQITPDLLKLLYVEANDVIDIQRIGDEIDVVATPLPPSVVSSLMDLYNALMPFKEFLTGGVHLDDAIRVICEFKTSLRNVDLTLNQLTITRPFINQATRAIKNSRDRNASTIATIRAVMQPIENNRQITFTFDYVTQRTALLATYTTMTQIKSPVSVCVTYEQDGLDIRLTLYRLQELADRLHLRESKISQQDAKAEQITKEEATSFSNFVKALTRSQDYLAKLMGLGFFDFSQITDYFNSVCTRDGDNYIMRVLDDIDNFPQLLETVFNAWDLVIRRIDERSASLRSVYPAAYSQLISEIMHLENVETVIQFQKECPHLASLFGHCEYQLVQRAESASEVPNSVSFMVLQVLKSAAAVQRQSAASDSLTDVVDIDSSIVPVLQSGFQRLMYISSYLDSACEAIVRTFRLTDGIDEVYEFIRKNEYQRDVLPESIFASSLFRVHLNSRSSLLPVLNIMALWSRKTLALPAQNVFVCTAVSDPSALSVFLERARKTNEESNQTVDESGINPSEILCVGPLVIVDPVALPAEASIALFRFLSEQASTPSLSRPVVFVTFSDTELPLYLSAADDVIERARRWNELSVLIDRCKVQSIMEVFTQSFYSQPLYETMTLMNSVKFSDRIHVFWSEVPQVGKTTAAKAFVSEGSGSRFVMCPIPGYCDVSTFAIRVQNALGRADSLSSGMVLQPNTVFGVQAVNSILVLQSFLACGSVLHSSSACPLPFMKIAIEIPTSSPLQYRALPDAQMSEINRVVPSNSRLAQVLGFGHMATDKSGFNFGFNTLWPGNEQLVNYEVILASQLNLPCRRITTLVKDFRLNANGDGEHYQRTYNVLDSLSSVRPVELTRIAEASQVRTTIMMFLLGTTRGLNEDGIKLEENCDRDPVTNEFRFFFRGAGTDVMVPTWVQDKSRPRNFPPEDKIELAYLNAFGAFEKFSRYIASETEAYVRINSTQGTDPSKDYKMRSALWSIVTNARLRVRMSSARHLQMRTISKIQDGIKNYMSRPDYNEIIRDTARGIHVSLGNTAENDIFAKVPDSSQFSAKDAWQYVFNYEGTDVRLIFSSLREIPSDFRSEVQKNDVSVVPQAKQAEKAFTDLTHNDLLDVLRFMAIPANKRSLVTHETIATANPLLASFRLTPDNTLKMINIYNGLAAGNPVCLMGESGCGKTSVVAYLSAVCGFELITLPCHAGLTEGELVTIVMNAAEMARSKVGADNKRTFTKVPKVLLFLDEINTSGLMDVISEIVVDHSCLGVHLPDSLAIAAAVNPYRLKFGAELDQADSQEACSSGAISSQAVAYKVHPLPEKMLDIVRNYGSIEIDQLFDYVDAVIGSHFGDSLLSQNGIQRTPGSRTPITDLSTDDNVRGLHRAGIRLLSLLTLSAHLFLLESDGTRSSVCLRDVRRCTQMGDYFLRYNLVYDSYDHFDYENQSEMTQSEFEEMSRRRYIDAAVLAVFFTYISRITSVEDQNRLYSRLSALLGFALEEYKCEQKGFGKQKMFASKGKSTNWVVRYFGYERGQSPFKSSLEQMDERDKKLLRKAEQQIVREISKYFGNFNSRFRGPRGGEEIREIVVSQCEAYFKQIPKSMCMNLSRNEALLQNVFMVTVSLVNRIPLIIIGIPGSSKTLSVSLILSLLENGGDTDSNYRFQMFPGVHSTFYQGALTTTSDAISHIFSYAASSIQEQEIRSGHKIPVVFFDEIGLAERSPFNPLKVLHALLEQNLATVTRSLENGAADEGDRVTEFNTIGQSSYQFTGLPYSFLAISNERIDPAKLSRVQLLNRVAPSLDDIVSTIMQYRANDNAGMRWSFEYTQRLARTVSFVLFGENDVVRLMSDDMSGTDANFGAELQQLHRGLNRHYFGLRDFYSFIRVMYSNTSIDYSGDLLYPTPEDVAAALRRSFCPDDRRKKDEMVSLLTYYITGVKVNIGATSARRLLEDSLRDEDGRHLMLVAPDGSAEQIATIVASQIGRDYRVFVGSSLEGDLHNEDYAYAILSQIILAMEKGMIVILNGLDTIWSSLYSMLNQSYMTSNNTRTVRVALGPYSQPACIVGDGFRVVVVMNTTQYRSGHTAFLNRFERHFVSYQDSVQCDDQLRPVVAPVIESITSLRLKFDEFIGFPQNAQKIVMSPFLDFQSLRDIVVGGSLIHAKERVQAANIELTEESLIKEAVPLIERFLTPESKVALSQCENSPLTTKQTNTSLFYDLSYYIADALESVEKNPAHGENLQLLLYNGTRIDNEKVIFQAVKKRMGTDVYGSLVVRSLNEFKEENSIITQITQVINSRKPAVIAVIVNDLPYLSTAVRAVERILGDLRQQSGSYVRTRILFLVRYSPITMSSVAESVPTEILQLVALMLSFPTEIIPTGLEQELNSSELLPLYQNGQLLGQMGDIASADSVVLCRRFISRIQSVIADYVVNTSKSRIPVAQQFAQDIWDSEPIFMLLRDTLRHMLSQPAIDRELTLLFDVRNQSNFKHLISYFLSGTQESFCAAMGRKITTSFTALAVAILLQWQLFGLLPELIFLAEQKVAERDPTSIAVTPVSIDFSRITKEFVETNMSWITSHVNGKIITQLKPALQDLKFLNKLRDDILVRGLYHARRLAPLGVPFVLGVDRTGQQFQEDVTITNQTALLAAPHFMIDPLKKHWDAFRTLIIGNGHFEDIRVVQLQSILRRMAECPSSSLTPDVAVNSDQLFEYICTQMNPRKVRILDSELHEQISRIINNNNYGADIRGALEMVYQVIQSAKDGSAVHCYKEPWEFLMQSYSELVSSPSVSVSDVHEFLFSLSAILDSESDILDSRDERESRITGTRRWPTETFIFWSILNSLYHDMLKITTKKPLVEFFDIFSSVIERASGSVDSRITSLLDAAYRVIENNLAVATNEPDRTRLKTYCDAVKLGVANLITDMRVQPEKIDQENSSLFANYNSGTYYTLALRMSLEVLCSQLQCEMQVGQDVDSKLSAEALSLLSRLIRPIVQRFILWTLKDFIPLSRLPHYFILDGNCEIIMSSASHIISTTLAQEPTPIAELARRQIQIIELEMAAQIIENNLEFFKRLMDTSIKETVMAHCADGKANTIKKFFSNLSKFIETLEGKLYLPKLPNHREQSTGNCYLDLIPLYRLVFPIAVRLAFNSKSFLQGTDHWKRTRNQIDGNGDAQDTLLRVPVDLVKILMLVSAASIEQLVIYMSRGKPRPNVTIVDDYKSITFDTSWFAKYPTRHQHGQNIAITPSPHVFAQLCQQIPAIMYTAAKYSPNKNESSTNEQVFVRVEQQRFLLRLITMVFNGVNVIEKAQEIHQTDAILMDFYKSIDLHHLAFYYTVPQAKQSFSMFGITSSYMRTGNPVIQLATTDTARLSENIMSVMSSVVPPRFADKLNNESSGAISDEGLSAVRLEENFRIQLRGEIDHYTDSMKLATAYLSAFINSTRLDTVYANMLPRFAGKDRLLAERNEARDILRQRETEIHGQKALSLSILLNSDIYSQLVDFKDKRDLSLFYPRETSNVMVDFVIAVTAGAVLRCAVRHDTKCFLKDFLTNPQLFSDCYLPGGLDCRSRNILGTRWFRCSCGAPNSVENCGNFNGGTLFACQNCGKNVKLQDTHDKSKRQWLPDGFKLIESDIPEPGYGFMIWRMQRHTYFSERLHDKKLEQFRSEYASRQSAATEMRQSSQQVQAIPKNVFVGFRVMRLIIDVAAYLFAYGAVDEDINEDQSKAPHAHWLKQVMLDSSSDGAPEYKNTLQALVSLRERIRIHVDILAKLLHKPVSPEFVRVVVMMVENALDVFSSHDTESLKNNAIRDAIEMDVNKFCAKPFDTIYALFEQTYPDEKRSSDKDQSASLNTIDAPFISAVTSAIYSGINSYDFYPFRSWNAYVGLFDTVLDVSPLINSTAICDEAQAQRLVARGAVSPDRMFSSLYEARCLGYRPDTQAQADHNLANTMQNEPPHIAAPHLLPEYVPQAMDSIEVVKLGPESKFLYYCNIYIQLACILTNRVKQAIVQHEEDLLNLMNSNSAQEGAPAMVVREWIAKAFNNNLQYLNAVDAAACALNCVRQLGQIRYECQEISMDLLPEIRQDESGHYDHSSLLPFLLVSGGPSDILLIKAADVHNKYMQTLLYGHTTDIQESLYLGRILTNENFQPENLLRLSRLRGRTVAYAAHTGRHVRRVNRLYGSDIRAIGHFLPSYGLDDIVKGKRFVDLYDLFVTQTGFLPVPVVTEADQGSARHIVRSANLAVYSMAPVIDMRIIFDAIVRNTRTPFLFSIDAKSIEQSQYSLKMSEFLSHEFEQPEIPASEEIHEVTQDPEQEDETLIPPSTVRSLCETISMVEDMYGLEATSLSTKLVAELINGTSEIVTLPVIQSVLDNHYVIMGFDDSTPIGEDLSDEAAQQLQAIRDLSDSAEICANHLRMVIFVLLVRTALRSVKQDQIPIDFVYEIPDDISPELKEKLTLLVTRAQADDESAVTQLSALVRYTSTLLCILPQSTCKKMTMDAYMQSQADIAQFCGYKMNSIELTIQSISNELGKFIIEDVYRALIPLISVKLIAKFN